MTNCPKCNSPMQPNKAGVMYCKPCAEISGKASRRKGNTYQCEGAAFLCDNGLHTLNTGIAQRRIADKSTPDLSSYPLWPDKSVLLRGEEKALANLPKWLWGRGPKRKLAEWWWQTLEGVRCGTCHGNGRHYIVDQDVPPSCYENCPDCKGTGWLSYPHDYLMIRRIADHEAKYDWLVLAGASHYVHQPLRVIDGGERADIYVYPADEWARAVGVGNE